MYSIETSYPVATTSLDHLYPKGVKNTKGGPNYTWTNGHNPFVDEVIEYFKQDNLPVLDIGAASGYLVNDFLIKGCDAVGVEGSDWPVKNKVSNWITHKDKRLFNSDISKPFQIYKNNEPAKFKLISAWEVAEHIHPDNLSTFANNVHKHLDDEGIFVMSVSPWFEPADKNQHKNINLHLAHEIKLKSQWKEIFNQFEFFGPIKENHQSGYHYVFKNRYRGKIRGPEGKRHTFWSSLKKK